jgi:hypothetical protein
MPSADREQRNAVNRAYYARHRDRLTAKQREHNAANRDKVNASNKASREAHGHSWPSERPAYKKRSEWKRAGIDAASIVRPMPAACELCGGSNGDKALACDHDHSTGRFRGWLCYKCNTGIGKLGDTVEGLQKALDYLRGTLN